MVGICSLKGCFRGLVLGMVLNFGRIDGLVIGL